MFNRVTIFVLAFAAFALTGLTIVQALELAYANLSIEPLNHGGPHGIPKEKNPHFQGGIGNCNGYGCANGPWN